VPSVKRPRHRPSCRRQLAVLTLGALLVTGSLGGCSTTQEKAAAHQAESERILEARKKRQESRNHGKHHADGTKSVPYGSKSARRHQERGK
jgi:hypothetical protein